MKGYILIGKDFYWHLKDFHHVSHACLHISTYKSVFTGTSEKKIL